MKRPPELANFFSEGKEISIEPSMRQGGASTYFSEFFWSI